MNEQRNDLAEWLILIGFTALSVAGFFALHWLTGALAGTILTALVFVAVAMIFRRNRKTR